MQKIGSISPQGVKEFGTILRALPFIDHLEIQNGNVCQDIGLSSLLEIDLIGVLGIIDAQFLVDKELANKLKNIPDQNSDFDLCENDAFFRLRGQFCDIEVPKVEQFKFSIDQFVWEASPSYTPALTIDVDSGSPESKAFKAAVVGKGPAVIEILEGGDWRIRGGKGSIYRGTPQDLVTDKPVLRSLCADVLPQIKGEGWKWSSCDAADSASQRSYLVAEIPVGSGLTIRLHEELFELFLWDRVFLDA